MAHPIESSTYRILKPDRNTVGTGFLVSKTLGVTCAHVVDLVDLDAKNRLQIKFTGQRRYAWAKVLPQYLDRARDVALLEIESVPTGVSPLRMGCSGESRLNSSLYTFGYASAAGEEKLGGSGLFIRYDPENNEVQFRMPEADHGHSGAPLIDETRGVVIGMVKKGNDQPGRNEDTTFAISCETIWQVCPQIKPPRPVLPKRSHLVEGVHLLPYDYASRIQSFLTEYLGTPEEPEPFGGRDDAIKSLSDWLEKGTPRLLLVAPAGRGKSALLVRWLDSLLFREDLALAFVPVSVRFGTNMERVVFASLAARLAFLHGEDVPASETTSTEVYRGLVSNYLSKPLANGKTLLVVLDGLDEASDWHAGTDLAPAELPQGVRVVVSTRFLAGDVDAKPWLRRLGWERKGAETAIDLAPLTQTGVADVLRKMGFTLDGLSRRVDIVAELFRLSEGDPLLVQLYVEDLWARGKKAARLRSEDLRGTKLGYDGFFDRWWSDQKCLWGKDAPLKEASVRLVLNLLTGAMGALDIDDMQALDSDKLLDTYSIQNALDSLGRFIISIQDERGNSGYVLSHPKLCNYFWEQLGEREHNAIEESFLNWGERILQGLIGRTIAPSDTPRYLVRYYSSHLERAHSPVEKFLPFIEYPQWHQAWFAYEGAYGGYLHDLNRTWKTCVVLDKQATEENNKAYLLGKEIRCALIETSLHSLAGAYSDDVVQ